MLPVLLNLPFARLGIAAHPPKFHRAIYIAFKPPLAVSSKELQQPKMGDSTIIGTTISYYKVIEKIGEGGMGEVWKATDTKANRDVALRILPEQFAMGFELCTRY
jgi:serine/threonine protein kinase